MIGNIHNQVILAQANYQQDARMILSLLILLIWKLLSIWNKKPMIFLITENFHWKSFWTEGFLPLMMQSDEGSIFFSDGDEIGNSNNHENLAH